MQVVEVHKFQRFRKWVLFSNRPNPITKKTSIILSIILFCYLHLRVWVDFLPPFIKKMFNQLSYSRTFFYTAKLIYIL